MNLSSLKSPSRNRNHQRQSTGLGLVDLGLALQTHVAFTYGDRFARLLGSCNKKPHQPPKGSGAKDQNRLKGKMSITLRDDFVKRFACPSQP